MDARISGTQRRLSRRTSLLAILLALPLVVGCGNGLARVDGQITVDGQPFSMSSDGRANVYFYPAGGTGAPAVGMVDEQGRFTARTGSQRGVTPGSYNIAISATQVIPSNKPGVPPSGRTLIDPRYANPTQSGFSVEVAPGSNSFEFNLEGKRVRLSSNQ